MAIEDRSRPKTWDERCENCMPAMCRQVNRASRLGYVRLRVFALYMVGEVLFLLWYAHEAYASVCTYVRK
jgi:hypothetical protein